jgi:DNA-binding beta-propeller fold protein YncE
VLYAASTEGSLTGIIGFDLETGVNISVADITEKELLNDITSDGSEYLYVTDCDADAIYRVSLSNMEYTVLVDEGLGYPNGIIYDDALNRLLVLNGGLAGRPLLAIDLATTAVSVVVETGLNAIDGLSVDANGLTYFSSWATDKVYRYDTAFSNPPEVVSEGHSNPADIFVNTVGGILAVPNFDGNTVDFLELQPQSVHGSSVTYAAELKAYPNPFGSFVTFDFSSVQDISMSHLVIRSLDGRVVRELDCSGISGSVTWSGDDSRGIPLPSGIYAVSAEIDGLVSSILVLKVN